MQSPKPNPRVANGHRRRQLRARVLREEHLCWLCGQPVDKTLPPGLPGSPEVDEVIPVSLGGSPLDRSNCRLACRLCNQRRGNGLRRQSRPRVPDFTAPTRTD
jgi:5-methylcytosine-specific restriction endonuclease McrA